MAQTLRGDLTSQEEADLIDLLAEKVSKWLRKGSSSEAYDMSDASAACLLRAVACLFTKDQTVLTAHQKVKQWFVKLLFCCTFYSMRLSCVRKLNTIVPFEASLYRRRRAAHSCAQWPIHLTRAVLVVSLALGTPVKACRIDVAVQSIKASCPILLSQSHRRLPRTK